MDGMKRREEIIRILENSDEPISGQDLANRFGVSRQVIVQDIALIRASNKNVLSTNRGYLLYQPEKESKPKRAIEVCHSDDEIEDELTTIIDFGGTILDVVIYHEVYGQISVDLFLRNHQEVKEFMEKLKDTKATPLKTLTADRHIHTVEASSESLLDVIEEKLKEKGYKD